MLVKLQAAYSPASELALLIPQATLCQFLGNFFREPARKFSRDTTELPSLRFSSRRASPAIFPPEWAAAAFCRNPSARMAFARAVVDFSPSIVKIKCPVMDMVTVSGTPDRDRFLTPDRRRSWNARVIFRLALLTAESQAPRKSIKGWPSRWKT